LTFGLAIPPSLLAAAKSDLAVHVFALGLATAVLAQTRRSVRQAVEPHRPREIDERTGRIDFFDTKSNRTGDGRIDRSTGKIDLYDVDGSLFYRSAESIVAAWLRVPPARCTRRERLVPLPPAVSVSP
jgi:hypothetical protein